VDDILWGQLYKMISQLEKHLADFSPRQVIADDSRHIVRLAITLSKDKLGEKMLVAGPPLNMKKNVANFRKSHKKARFITKSKKIWAQVRRPMTRPEQYVMEFFKSFEKTKSHLAYPHEMIVVERYSKTKSR
jgi:tRNA nucleotidyltransferase (CCA-adding enzyme)